MVVELCDEEAQNKYLSVPVQKETERHITQV
jgi:hypothetical protein